MKKSFAVELEKESLIFSAAHFITFGLPDGTEICESVHGHNYRIACRVQGDLDEHACVIDFIWLRDRLQEIAAKLDRHVLLPDSHPRIKVTKNETEVEVTYQEKRWVFPEQDVAILPMDNTTAERLAEYISDQLQALLNDKSGVQIGELSVGVDENEGQWAWCRTQR